MIFKKLPAKEKRRYMVDGVEVVIVPALCGNCVSYNQKTGVVMVYAKTETDDISKLIDKAKALKGEQE